MLAAFLDTLFQLAIQIVWVIVLFVTGFARGLGGWMPVIYLTGAFAIDSAYFAGTEIAMGGRTPGKRIIGLRVVTRGGGTAGVGALLTRNLIRVVDVIVGVPLMAIDPLARRLGDRLAGTVVIHDRAVPAEPLLRRIPRGWQGEDVALVESLLRRAGDLEPARAEGMAARVIARLEREEPEFLGSSGRAGGSVARLRQAFGVESS